MTFLIANITTSLNRFIEVSLLSRSEIDAELLLRYFTANVSNTFDIYYIFHGGPRVQFGDDVALYFKTYNYRKEIMLPEKDYLNIPDGYLIVRISDEVPRPLVDMIMEMFSAEEYAPERTGEEEE